MIQEKIAITDNREPLIFNIKQAKIEATVKNADGNGSGTHSEDKILIRRP